VVLTSQSGVREVVRPGGKPGIDDVKLARYDFSVQ